MARTHQTMLLLGDAQERPASMITLTLEPRSAALQEIVLGYAAEGHRNDYGLYIESRL